MEALTLDDLLPLDELVRRRRELFAAHAPYLDRYRRVRVGPRLTLVFENRQTLWFRVQEVVRIARLDVKAEPDRLQQQLDLHNRLLPRRDCLQAALVLSVDEDRWAEEMVPWRELRGDQIALHVGPKRYPANLLTSRPEDRAAGAAHWVQFVLDADARAWLADSAKAALLTARLPEYRHDSGPLCDDVRQSLLEDLRPSIRDHEKRLSHEYHE